MPKLLSQQRSEKGRHRLQTLKFQNDTRLAGREAIGSRKLAGEASGDAGKNENELINQTAMSPNVLTHWCPHRKHNRK